MNNLTRFTALVIIITASLSIQAQLAVVNSGLPVVGFVTEEGKKCADAQVSIYEGNQLVNRFHTPRNGKFQLLMHMDKYYTLEVSKTGYISKRVAFDTRVDSKQIQVPVYELDLDLIPTIVLGDQDTGDLDFPMAVVSYVPKEKAFIHNEEYTSHMRTTYESMLKVAFEANVSQ